MDEHIHRLIQQLAAPLQDLRDQARAALRARGAGSVPALLEALGDPERAVRAGAALTLGELRAGEAAAALATVAESDPDPSVRPLALRALSDLAHPGCAEVVQKTLLGKLTDPDLFARALACTGLGRIGNDVCREALRTALRDREDWVRQAARQALVALPAAPPSAESTPAGPQLALMTRPGEALATVQAPSPADALIAQLASLDLDTQRQAQEGLQALGPEVVAKVAALLRDPLPHVRRGAAEVLGAIGSLDALPFLEELLVDAEPGDDLRAMALHALTSILLESCEGDGLDAPNLVELLRQHLDRNDAFVRGAAAAALIAASPIDRVPVLEHLQDEDEEWVRVVVARALSRVGRPADRAIVPLLLDELAVMTDVNGQRYLLDCLLRVLAEPQPDDAATVVGPVSFFLESEHVEVRQRALAVLTRTARPPNPRLLRTFIGLLAQDAENLELVGAVQRLALPGDPSAVPALRQALGGKSEEAAAAAAGALAHIGGRAALDALIDSANDRAGRTTALASQALAALDPAAELIAVRRPDGRWERRLQLRCGVDGETLRWVERQQREELRCPRCDREYAVSAAEKLFAADRTPFGLCQCRGCRRKQLLVRRGDSETLICPASGEVHIRPFDHPRQLRLLADLPLGACTCCAEPQPLIRVDDEVRCYRTRQLYRPGARGFEPAAEPTPAAEDIAAINRALLLGTLGIAESGLAASDVPVADPRLPGDPEGQGRH